VSALTNLRVLVVAGYPDHDLGPVSALRHLEYLSLLDCRHVTDLSPLAEFPALRTLRLQSLPSWDSSGKVIEVDSLAPLARIPQLEHLELFGVCPQPERTLADLQPAPRLRTVRVSKYPNAEVARYRAATGTGDDFAPEPGISEWD